MAGITPNPKKRGYLLPKGCKDLIDALNGKPGRPLSIGKVRVRINDMIEASPVRVIDAVGRLVGIKTLAEALEMARAKDLDLVEIFPRAKPPVCVIIDWAKL
jgi:hypothetical protein